MLIGITGGIGSGKSTIAKALQGMGYPLYDTDSEAKRIMQHNPAVRSQVEYLFGSDVYDGDTYLPQRVAPLVFANPTLLRQLNRVVHPAVGYDVRQWAKTKPVCLVESAILFSSGLADICDKTVLVTAPEEVRIRRTILRDNATREAVVARIKSQAEEENLSLKADLIVVNDGTKTIEEIAQDILRLIANEA